MGLGTMIAGKVFDEIKKKSKEHKNNSLKPVKDHNSELPPLQIQVYSHNVRQDTDNLADGEKPWKERREGVCANIYYSSQKYPTVVGLQEVKQNQLHDILYGLGNDWAYFGVGREDGKTKGEFAPILYKKNEWEVLNSATYWLSENPGYPNKGWDAKFPRITTVVSLKHKKLGKIINFFNTHYDHKGKQARINSSKQIMKLMDSIGGVSFLSGDLNSEGNAEAYRTFKDGGLLDSAQHCKDKRGFECTMTGFKQGERESSIDFIWSQKNVPIIKHEILDSDFKGVRCSDHRPVVAVYEV